MLLMIVNEASVAQISELDSVVTNEDLLKGRWQGSLAGDFRDQELSWHFEVTEYGDLQGFVGATDRGRPTLPMENLILRDDRLSFRIASQNIAYEGVIGSDSVTGTWDQGLPLPLTMNRRIFSFVVPASISSSIIGQWETRIGPSLVEVNFSEVGNGTIIGHLDVSTLQLREMAIVELGVDSEGFLSFSTDTNREFTGRILNGVLLGNYRYGSTNDQVAFTKPENDDADYYLGFSEREKALLLGKWRANVSGTTVIFNFEETDDGNTIGQIDVGRDRGTPVLDVEMQDKNVIITTLNNRSFNGQLIDSELIGEYHVGGGATYTEQFQKTE